MTNSKIPRYVTRLSFRDNLWFLRRLTTIVRVVTHFSLLFFVRFLVLHVLATILFMNKKKITRSIQPFSSNELTNDDQLLIIVILRLYIINRAALQARSHDWRLTIDSCFATSRVNERICRVFRFPANRTIHDLYITSMFNIHIISATTGLTRKKHIYRRTVPLEWHARLRARTPCPCMFFDPVTRTFVTSVPLKVTKCLCGYCFWL